MACERYETWIVEAAHGSLSAAREEEWTAHISQCVGCRGALEREQRLLDAIDRGAEASVAAEPSPAFLSRVRTRLAQEPEQQSHRRLPWEWVAAGAFAVLIIVVGILHH